jgi:hypothetical protein
MRQLSENYVCMIRVLVVTVLRDQSCLIWDLDVEKSELLHLGSRCGEISAA